MNTNNPIRYCYTCGRKLDCVARDTWYDTETGEAYHRWKFWCSSRLERKGLPWWRRLFYYHPIDDPVKYLYP